MYTLLYRKIPEDGGLKNTGIDINAIGDGPLFSCYSCDLVKRYPKHYIGSADKVSVVDVYKPWICPGGAEAPRNCKSGVDHLIPNNNTSKCICENGWYGSEVAGCKACEAGYYCVDGEKKQCDDHFYQDGIEQTSCDPCSSTGDQDGSSDICGTGKQLPLCLQSDPSSQNQPLINRCVTCALCTRHYISPIAGQKDCYRS